MGVGAYSKWALIGGWALIRINTVISTDIEIMLKNFFLNFSFLSVFITMNTRSKD